MKQHAYKITVEKIRNADGTKADPSSTFSFTASNHDDIKQIVTKVQARGDFDEDTAAGLAVGLKLFGEVMLTHRNHSLFIEFAPHFKEFMKRLKTPKK